MSFKRTHGRGESSTASFNILFLLEVRLRSKITVEFRPTSSYNYTILKVGI